MKTTKSDSTKEYVALGSGKHKNRSKRFARQKKRKKSLKKRIEATHARKKKRKTLFRSILVLTIIVAIVALVGWYLFQQQPQGNFQGKIFNWQRVLGLGVNPDNNQVIYVATDSGLVKGILDGVWEQVGGDRSLYGDLVIHPQDGGTLYSTAHPQQGESSSGVRRSTNGGLTWEVIATVLDPPVEFHTMTISPADPNILYGWDAEPPSGRGLFKSVDGGLNWTEIPLPAPGPSLSAHPTNASVVLAGTGIGLFISEDGGQNWRLLLEDTKVIAVAYSQVMPEVLYASTVEQGLIKSEDGGKTWKTVGSGIHSQDVVSRIVTDPVDGEIVYVASLLEPERDISSIYRSVDGGQTWSLLITNSGQHPLLSG